MQVLTRAYLNAMRAYFDAEGRATRTEIFLYLVAVAATLLASLVLGVTLSRNQPFFWTGLVLLVHLIPTLTIVVRRLHDSGTSAWWLLIGVVPYVGPALLLLWMLLPSSSGQNKFGPPSYSSQAAARVEPAVISAPLATSAVRPKAMPSPLPKTLRKASNQWMVAQKLPGETLIKPTSGPAKVDVPHPVPAAYPTDKRARYEALRESGMLSEAEYLQLIKRL